jgi:aryl-alcohol dehydrogenase-like predicted oxidoreductase
MTSLENSLLNLKREVLDIVQIHNAKAEDIQRGEIIEFLQEAQEKGLVRFLGASVYGEEAAVHTIEHCSLDLLQIAYSILDQRPRHSLFGRAAITRTGIVVRSALLKGVLTKKAAALPHKLEELRHAAKKVCKKLECNWLDLPEKAIRFCISSPHLSSVLIGARTSEELAQALAAIQAGPLSDEEMSLTPALGLSEEALVNPSLWSLP